MNEDYWETYYFTGGAPFGPSPFCEYVASTYRMFSSVIDVGCGNGRDSFFFADCKFSVVGLDRSYEAIARCNLKIVERQSQNIVFMCSDVVEADFDEIVIAHNMIPEKTIIYSRFFLHSIDEEAEDIFLSRVKQLVLAGAVLCMEFRAPEDRFLHKLASDHERRFIDIYKLEDKCRMHGFNTELSVVGTGLARFGPEDPIVARLIVR